MSDDEHNFEGILLGKSSREERICRGIVNFTALIHHRCHIVMQSL